MNFLTCKITPENIILAFWEGYTVIKFKKLNKECSKKINLICRIFKIDIHNVIYFDSTGEYKKFFPWAIKIKPDRQPFKRENYKNLKHQLYFCLIDSINKGEFIIKEQSGTPKDIFIQELDQVQLNPYSENSKLEIISRKQIKENIGRDIDLIDLVSYRYFAKLKGIG